ncbi:unnamed protein product [Prorocentrum cordatum]|uniref:Uncharacterized protein n=1 Tax=Prorocentrum cordatum TaxID=2364126 RepID=A0ABN9VTN1_9DINO|nr:unnamed protein product [Polarella glacialis]
MSCSAARTCSPASAGSCPGEGESAPHPQSCQRPRRRAAPPSAGSAEEQGDAAPGTARCWRSRQMFGSTLGSLHRGPEPRGRAGAGGSRCVEDDAALGAPLPRQLRRAGRREAAGQGPGGLGGRRARQLRGRKSLCGRAPSRGGRHADRCAGGGGRQSAIENYAYAVSWFLRERDVEVAMTTISRAVRAPITYRLACAEREFEVCRRLSDYRVQTNCTLHPEPCPESPPLRCSAGARIRNTRNSPSFHVFVSLPHRPPPSPATSEQPGTKLAGLHFLSPSNGNNIVGIIFACLQLAAIIPRRTGLAPRTAAARAVCVDWWRCVCRHHAVQKAGWIRD